MSRLSLCAALGGLALALSGCALIGYDLGPGSDPEAGRTGDGSSGQAAADTGGANSTGAAAGRGGGSAAGASGRGGQAGTDAATPVSGSGGDADASSGADAATDGGVGDDAGLLPDPCPGMPDGTPCDINSFCKSSMRCSNGTCAGVTDRDCSALDEGCMEGVCVEAERRCVAKDVADGTNCGLGRTCTDGVCGGSGQGCGFNLSCDLTCDGEPCGLDCNGVDACTIGCTAGAVCDIGCQDVDHCVTTCESSDCDIDCRIADICDVVCTDSSCRIRCEGTLTCDTVECGPGASCVIECGAGDCDFAVCAANDVQQCPDGELVCGRDCP